MTSIAIALCYVIVFPWFELGLARAMSFGKRARNDFYTEEREWEIGRRKLIAQEQANIIEMELKNRSDQSKLADIQLVKSYQNILQGENFGRWLNDIKNGPIHNNLQNTINNYLNMVDSIEGKFINSEIELAHANFVSDLSTLVSALSDGKLDETRRADIIKFGSKALASQQEYRKKVRELLGV